MSGIITQVGRDGEYNNHYPTVVPNHQSNNEARRTPFYKLLQRFKRFKMCMCCCFRKAQSMPVQEAQTIENQAVEHAVPLLGTPREPDKGKRCVVIDLDETLVHSSFKPVPNPDFIIPVDLDGVIHQVYVLKRPYVDEFLAFLANKFECVLFTASLAKYADPVSDLLDVHGCFSTRLFREACSFHKGNYVKDLARLGRNVDDCLIIDNSPASYYFHPEYAIPVSSWFDDASDTELLDLIPFFDVMLQLDKVPVPQFLQYPVGKEP